MSSFDKNFRQRANAQFKANKKFLHRLGDHPPRGLDQLFETLHNEVFKEINCLDCANCCKTTSPIFTKTDISRIARVVGMTVPAFEKKYLRTDEDGDWVLQTAPCPFLNAADNRCKIYDDRPKACREYPHTNRKPMYEIMGITARNTLVCPATFEIVERLKNVL